MHAHLSIIVAFSKDHSIIVVPIIFFSNLWFPSVQLSGSVFCLNFESMGFRLIKTVFPLKFLNFINLPSLFLIVFFV